jgi:HD-GYP domain-containing protein (c-di-GMP phosphodiesterase class II)
MLMFSMMPVEGIENEVLEELVEIFERFHMQSEGVALALEKEPFNFELILKLKKLFKDVLLQVLKLNLTPFYESLEDSIRILDKLSHWQVYPNRMSELILLVNDRTLMLVRDLFAMKAIDIRKTQQILVSLQHIVLVEVPDQLTNGVESAIKTIVEEINYGVKEEDNNEVTIFDDVDMFQDSTPLSTKTIEKVEIFIPKDSVNPVLQARDFIACEITDNAIQLLTQISDVAAGHSTSHTDLMMELCLACNIVNGYPIDSKSLSIGICFHDVAMAANSHITNKKEALTKEEIYILQQHPIEGLELLNKFDQSETARQVVLEHHERYNGNGYPHKLKGNQISDAGKITGIVDSFHGMISNRPYKEYTKDTIRAATEINACVNTLYDYRWVKTFNECLRKYWLPMYK